MTRSDPEPEPILLPACDVAQMLQISSRTLWRLVAADKIVGPIKIGRSVRWRKDELLRWIAEGCPSRSDK